MADNDPFAGLLDSVAKKATEFGAAVGPAVQKAVDLGASAYEKSGDALGSLLDRVEVSAGAKTQEEQDARTNYARRLGFNVPHPDAASYGMVRSGAAPKDWAKLGEYAFDPKAWQLERDGDIWKQPRPYQAPRVEEIDFVGDKAKIPQVFDAAKRAFGLTGQVHEVTSPELAEPTVRAAEFVAKVPWLNTTTLLEKWRNEANAKPTDGTSSLLRDYVELFRVQADDLPGGKMAAEHFATIPVPESVMSNESGGREKLPLLITVSPDTAPKDVPDVAEEAVSMPQIAFGKDDRAWREHASGLFSDSVQEGLNAAPIAAAYGALKGLGVIDTLQGRDAGGATKALADLMTTDLRPERFGMGNVDIEANRKLVGESGYPQLVQQHARRLVDEALAASRYASPQDKPYYDSVVKNARTFADHAVRNAIEPGWATPNTKRTLDRLGFPKFSGELMAQEYRPGESAPLTADESTLKSGFARQFAHDVGLDKAFAKDAEVRAPTLDAWSRSLTNLLGANAMMAYQLGSALISPNDSADTIFNKFSTAMTDLGAGILGMSAAPLALVTGQVNPAEAARAYGKQFEDDPFGASVGLAAAFGTAKNWSKVGLDKFAKGASKLFGEDNRVSKVVIPKVLDAVDKMTKVAGYIPVTTMGQWDLAHLVLQKAAEGKGKGWARYLLNDNGETITGAAKAIYEAAKNAVSADEVSLMALDSEMAKALRPTWKDRSPPSAKSAKLYREAHGDAPGTAVSDVAVLALDHATDSPEPEVSEAATRILKRGLESHDAVGEFQMPSYGLNRRTERFEIHPDVDAVASWSIREAARLRMEASRPGVDPAAADAMLQKADSADALVQARNTAQTTVDGLNDMTAMKHFANKLSEVTRRQAESGDRPVAGVSEADYDAIKQRVATAEQDLAARAPADDVAKAIRALTSGKADIERRLKRFQEKQGTFEAVQEAVARERKAIDDLSSKVANDAQKSAEVEAMVGPLRRAYEAVDKRGAEVFDALVQNSPESLASREAMLRPFERAAETMDRKADVAETRAKEAERSIPSKVKTWQRFFNHAIKAEQRISTTDVVGHRAATRLREQKVKTLQATELDRGIARELVDDLNSRLNKVTKKYDDLLKRSGADEVMDQIEEAEIVIESAIPGSPEYTEATQRHKDAKAKLTAIYRKYPTLKTLGEAVDHIEAIEAKARELDTNDMEAEPKGLATELRKVDSNIRNEATRKEADQAARAVAKDITQSQARADALRANAPVVDPNARKQVEAERAKLDADHRRRRIDTARFAELAKSAESVKKMLDFAERHAEAIRQGTAAPPIEYRPSAPVLQRLMAEAQQNPKMQPVLDALVKKQPVTDIEQALTAAGVPEDRWSAYGRSLATKQPFAVRAVHSVDVANTRAGGRERAAEARAADQEALAQQAEQQAAVLGKMLADLNLEQADRAFAEKALGWSKKALEESRAPGMVADPERVMDTRTVAEEYRPTTSQVKDIIKRAREGDKLSQLWLEAHPEHEPGALATKNKPQGTRGGSSKSQLTNLFNRMNVPYDVRVNRFGLVESTDVLRQRLLHDMIASNNHDMYYHLSRLDGTIGSPHQEGYIKMPDDAIQVKVGGEDHSIPKWGALSGKWVPEDLYYQLVADDVFAREASTLQGKYTKYFKFAHVPANYLATVRNNLTNFFAFAPLAGIEPWNPRNWKYYTQAFLDLVKPYDKRSKRWSEQEAHGSSRANYASGELNMVKNPATGGAWGLIYDLAAKTANLADAPRFRRALMAWIHHVFAETPSALYSGAGDDPYRLALQYKLRDQGMSPAEAAARGKRDFVDYSALPGFVRFLSHPEAHNMLRDKWGRAAAYTVYYGAGMPFAAFPFKGMQLINGRMKSDPRTFVRLAAMARAANMAALHNVGMNEQEWERIREHLPGTFKSRALLSTERTPEGDVRFQTADLGFLNPVAQSLDSPLSLIGNNPTIRPILGSASIYKTGRDWTNNAQVITHVDTQDKVADYFKWLSSLYVPAWFPGIGSKARMQDTVGQPNYLGQVNTERDAAIKGTLGINTASITQNQAGNRALRDAVSKLHELVAGSELEAKSAPEFKYTPEQLGSYRQMVGRYQQTRDPELGKRLQAADRHIAERMPKILEELGQAYIGLGVPRDVATGRKILALAQKARERLSSIPPGAGPLAAMPIMKALQDLVKADTIREVLAPAYGLERR